MKKLLMTVFSYFVVINLFASTFIDTTYFFNVFEKEFAWITLLSGNRFFKFSVHRDGFDLSSSLILHTTQNIKLEIKDHYIRNSINKSETDEIYDYFILGNGIIILFENVAVLQKTPIFVPYVMRSDFNDNNSYDYKVWKIFKDVKQYSLDSLFNVSVFDAGVKYISASSFLSENTKKGLVEYKSNNVAEKLYYTSQEDYDIISYDSVTPPWVEGKDGYGIGEYLDIEFKWKSDELQILNGFVDFTRMKLYEENSRVKTILIESEDPKFSQEYELEDIVRYSLIQLPQKTDKIRMTIKDVYPGTKYKDTCLSSILVTNPNVPSYEEMSEKILKSMEEGVIDFRSYSERKMEVPSFIKIIED